MKYEQEAYEESMRATVEKVGISILANEDYRRRMVKRFTGAAYVWTWPFKKSVERWYDDTTGRIRLGLGISA